jgi:hypothetical protein
MKYAALIAFLFILPFLFVGSAHAVSDGTVTVNPAYLEVSLQNPEQEKSFTIGYTNSGRRTISLEISAIDFKQQNERGGISFLGEQGNVYSYSLSSFLTFATNNLILEPNATEELLVTVKNRQDLSPGGHYAAIIAKVSSESDTPNVISPAVSSLIFMRKIGGERFNLSIRSIDWPDMPVVFQMPQTTEAVFQNEGNIHVVPYGRIDVKDMFGRNIYKGILNNTSAIVMPETRRVIPITFTRLAWMMPISLNTMQLEGSDLLKKTNYTYQETFLYINPISLLFLLLLPALLLIKRIKSQRPKSKA